MPHDPLSSRTSIMRNYEKPAAILNRSEKGPLLYFGAVGRGGRGFRFQVSGFRFDSAEEISVHPSRTEED